MTELQECQHTLGRAIEVIAMTCVAQGQADLAEAFAGGVQG